MIGLPIAVILFPAAFAIDPFTAMTVASTATQVISTASEVSGTLDSFSELYSEIDTGASISEDGQKLVNQIQEVEALATEAGYTSQEIDQLGHQDHEEVKKLQGNIRAVTRAVKAGKRTFKLFSRLEQKAQVAQVESTAIEKEQLAALYKVIRLEQESNLAEIRKSLQEQVNRRHQITALRQELKEKGAKIFGATGILSFPKSDRILETVLQASLRLRGPLIGLMLIVFLARLLFYQFGFFGVSRIGDLVRDTILCSMLLMVYPELIRMVVYFSTEIASQIGANKVQDIKPNELDLPAMKDVLTSSKLLFLWMIDWIKFAAFTLIDFAMTFGLSFLVMLFPLVIFASQMMNFSVAWPMFLGGFISLSLWPLFWNLVGYVAELSWGQSQKNFSESLYSVFFTVLQAFSPVIGMKLLAGQSLSKAALGSLSSFSKFAGSGASSLAKSKMEFDLGRSSMNRSEPTFSVAGMNGLPSVARIAGSSHGYFSNQITKKLSGGNKNQITLSRAKSHTKKEPRIND